MQVLREEKTTGVYIVQIFSDGKLLQPVVGKHNYNTAPSILFLSFKALI